MMCSDFGSDDLTAIAITVSADRRIEIRASSVCIRDVRVSRATVVSYLRTIADDKQEIALIHALDVGVAEILARRRRRQNQTGR